VDSTGNVYVADSGNERIQKFDADGRFLTAWGSPGNSIGEFTQPFGVAVDSSGNVYVADYGNSRIQKFDAGGRFLTTWGMFGDGDGEFNWPTGIAVDSSGNVYVADNGNERIQKFALMDLTDSLVFDATCPVYLTITDPDGLTIDKDATLIPEATYIEFGEGSDGTLDARIIIPDKKTGVYSITVTPKGGASSTDTFTLEVSSGTETKTVANTVKIEDIPTTPYGVQVTPGGGIIIIGGTVIPEFPSMFLPATMIIGFLGAVLLIRRTREH
jgi:hypothetical protein